MENVNAKKAENRRILQERLVTLQKQVSNQKIKLSTSIFILKKKELQKNNICICRGFCRIHHDKHNYTKSKSDELLRTFNTFHTEEKFEESFAKTTYMKGCIPTKYKCNKCESEFSKQGSLKKHIRKEHRKDGRETELGK